MNIPKDNKQEWDEYLERELTEVTLVVSQLGFSLEKEQIHTIGERYLMSGKKLVLIGRREKDNKKMVIKASSDEEGKKELSHEHLYRKP